LRKAEFVVKGDGRTLRADIGTQSIYIRVNVLMRLLRMLCEREQFTKKKRNFLCILPMEKSGIIYYYVINKGVENLKSGEERVLPYSGNKKILCILTVKIP